MRRLTALAVAIAAGVAITIVALESGGGTTASASTGPVATAAVVRTTAASPACMSRRARASLTPAGAMPALCGSQPPLRLGSSTLTPWFPRRTPARI